MYLSKKIEKRFGLIVIGDEILSGKRTDKHLQKVIELLKNKGLSLGFAEYVPDDEKEITQTFSRIFEQVKSRGDIVFCTGGIGSTPDDHTRAAAAAALGVPLCLIDEARVLINQRGAEIARDNNVAFDEDSAENLQRLQMGYWPVSVNNGLDFTGRILHNIFNKIPAYAIDFKDSGGSVYFLAGFPVMSWPMIGYALDNELSYLTGVGGIIERSLLVRGIMESRLAPLMLEIQSKFPPIKVFSLPCVAHEKYDAHIELGIKKHGSNESELDEAWQFLVVGLRKLGAEIIEN